MGSVHATAYANSAGVEVAAVYGRNRSKIGPIAERVGARASTDLRAILDDPSVGAVDVCLPSPVHREFVVAALEAGKYVFCETPLALTQEDAQAMLDASQANDRLLLVGLLMRSIAAYQYIKRALDAGQVGKPVAAYAYRLGSYLRPNAADFKEHYSDPTTELMTFDFDALNWLLGSPQELSATAARLPDGRPGHVFAAVRYSSNVIAQVEASGVMPASFPFSVGFRLVGEEQALELTTVFGGDGPPDSRLMSYPANGKPEEVQLFDGDPYEAECQYFVDCVRGEADPELLSAERAIEALKLSFAAQTSLRQGKPVQLATA